MGFFDFACSATSAVPISYEIRRPRFPCAKALIKDNEQLHLLAISPRFRPCCSKEKMTVDQFMNDIRYDRIVFCKSKDTKVPGEINTIVSMDTLASRLKQARKESGMSQDELAEKCGMTRGGIGHLETGRRNGATNLAQIADALGVNALWLAEGKGPKSAASLKTVRYAIDEFVADEGTNKKNNLSQELPFYDIGKPAGTLVDELQSRDIPPHIEQAIMALLQTCQKRDKKSQQHAPIFTDKEQKRHIRPTPKAIIAAALLFIKIPALRKYPSSLATTTPSGARRMPGICRYAFTQ